MYLCLAFLVWKLPDKFAGLLSGGGPSVSGGEAVGGAMMAAGGARRVAGAVTGGVAAVAGAAMTGAAMKYQANRNSAMKNKINDGISNASNKITQMQSYLNQRNPDGSYKYTGKARQVLAQRLGQEQKRLKGLEEEKKAIGATTMKGMFGTKVGAKLLEGWVARRENIRRDKSQVDAAFSDKRAERDF